MTLTDRIAALTALVEAQQAQINALLARPVQAVAKPSDYRIVIVRGIPTKGDPTSTYSQIEVYEQGATRDQDRLIVNAFVNSELHPGKRTDGGDQHVMYADRRTPRQPAATPAAKPVAQAAEMKF